MATTIVQAGAAGMGGMAGTAGAGPAGGADPAVADGVVRVVAGVPAGAPARGGAT